MSDPYQNIIDTLTRSKRVMITTHAKPDGDALGSTAALVLGLRKKNIDAEMILFGILNIGIESRSRPVACRDDKLVRSVQHPNSLFVFSLKFVRQVQLPAFLDYIVKGSLAFFLRGPTLPRSHEMGKMENPLDNLDIIRYYHGS